MKSKKAYAGKRGDKVRSDCYIELKIKRTGGLKIDLKSKVHSMYGESIVQLLEELCDHFSIFHADVYCEDFGALPFTIMARFESAVKRIDGDCQIEYLPLFNKANKYVSKNDSLRRSRLYLPGNEPKFFPNAGLHSPDGIILDLEDSVAPSEKDAAQILVRNALRSVDFYDAERMVRINQLPKGLDDLKYIVPNNVHVILIPKCESATQIKNVEREVEFLREIHKIKYPIYFMPIIESALGVEKAYEIATASSSNCALAVGLEDYTADIGAERTKAGTESFTARTRILNAAKAAGIQAIDTVFSDVSDTEGLIESVLEAKSLGFEGKGCIHPRQIKTIHKYFSPNSEEIEKAKKIVLAYDKAIREGLGVVSMGSKMIDAPIVKRALRIVNLGILNGQIPTNWKNN
ncbi:MAG: HpcH/HpaI aldolase/citrate lyase family protein [Melioribacteraceae bacterium]|nr:HpcH/HpaI aldolase/citrate lyase family protein [Melioribacteraceae bacterium]